VYPFGRRYAAQDKYAINIDALIAGKHYQEVETLGLMLGASEETPESPADANAP
jgi:hypothetical protein